MTTTVSAPSTQAGKRTQAGTPQQSQPIALLKVISLLMDYPSEAIFDHGDELNELINASRFVSPSIRAELTALLDDLLTKGLMDAQESYDSLFERGRSLSLLLFEHVHGESRDRGQAMVDLIEQYRDAGFELSVKELPDYIPLYLEFLSTSDALDARVGLADVSHILAMLSARLTERGSHYAACFNALLQIAGQDVQALVNDAADTVASEARDDTLEAMDAAWEEEVVDFMAAEQESRCPSSTTYKTAPQHGDTQKPLEPAAAPVHWVGFNQKHPSQGV